MAGWVGGWLGGPVIIVPLCDSILQAETCQILSLAENPRWSPSVAIREGLKKKQDKLGLLAEPPLTPPPQRTWALLYGLGIFFRPKAKVCPIFLFEAFP